jgi:hypothetical protein
LEKIGPGLSGGPLARNSAAARKWLSGEEIGWQPSCGPACPVARNSERIPRPGRGSAEKAHVVSSPDRARTGGARHTAEGLTHRTAPAGAGLSSGCTHRRSVRINSAAGRPAPWRAGPSAAELAGGLAHWPVGPLARDSPWLRRVQENARPCHRPFGPWAAGRGVRLAGGVTRWVVVWCARHAINPSGGPFGAEHQMGPVWTPAKAGRLAAWPVGGWRKGLDDAREGWALPPLRQAG